MDNVVEKIIKTIQSYSFCYDTEIDFQNLIAQVFENENINYKRECKISDDSIIDFMVDDIGIEVKIKGQKKAIFRQCRRYCDSESIKSLIVVSGKSLSLPTEINNKKVYTLRVFHR